MSHINAMPSLSAVAIAEMEYALDCQAEADAHDAVILDGLEARLLGLQDREFFTADGARMAAGGLFAVAVALVTILGGAV